MPNLLQTSAAWLGGKLQAHAGRTVRIKQGARRISNAMTATVQNHDYEITDLQGLPSLVKSYDWTFVAGDLGDLNIRTGDVLTEMVGSVEVQYEAMPIGKRPCVEDLDSSGVLLTVHTKKVS